MFNPSSVIYSSALLTYFFALVMSEIFNQGIFPFSQYFFTPRFGVPPAETSAIDGKRAQAQPFGNSKGKFSNKTGSLLPTFS